MSDSQQSFYDDNRARFDAETTQVPATFKKCTHKRLQRVSASEVQCACGAGWIENGKWQWVK